MLDVKKKNLPDLSGVYFFLGEDGKILYIGKATSLRDRVRSYFSQDIAVTRGPKIVRMLKLVADVKWRTTDSVLEALLLESHLIKKHQPPYNTDEKDDKSYSYVVITKEKFPRVLLMRGRDINTSLASDATSGVGFGTLKYLFGPFPQGGSLREALKIVRRIFPFRDTCVPLSGKPCFNHQIGLCPGVCVGKVTPQEYAKTIRNIRFFFEGKKKSLVKKLESEMKEAAKKQEFEKANELKKTLFALGHIRDVALLKKDFLSPSIGEGRVSFRIEAYDAAHLSGKNVVGVMTVVEDGRPEKGEYRKFKIRNESGNDLASLEEMLSRRLNHPEWRLPDLIVVDGFDLQIRTAERILRERALNIPVVSVVKDASHKPKDILRNKNMAEKHHDAILLANNEAHRFAITFHRARRGKNFLSVS